MTFEEIQDAVMTSLNLQSDEARTRIKAHINLRYRQVQSGLNLARTRRGGGTVVTVSGAPTAIVSGTAKIFGLYDDVVRHRVLDEPVLAEIKRLEAASDETGCPRAWAVETHVADEVVVRWFPTPDDVYTFDMDRLAAGTEMDDDEDEPTFPVDFHDILVTGAKADEYEKLDKMQAAARQEAKFEKRLAELRFFLIKSGYKRGAPHDESGFSVPGARRWPYGNGVG